MKLDFVLTFKERMMQSTVVKMQKWTSGFPEDVEYTVSVDEEIVYESRNCHGMANGWLSEDDTNAEWLRMRARIVDCQVATVLLEVIESNWRHHPVGNRFVIRTGQIGTLQQPYTYMINARDYLSR